MEDERREAFSAAFIAQAQADWNAYRALAALRSDHQSSFPSVDRCQFLHYLQMTCEKVAKAYRLRDTTAPVDELVSKHTGFEKFVQPFLLAALASEFQGKRAQLRAILKNFRTIARDIEKLAPAIDRTHAPENAEYPWEQGGKVVAPCRYSFPSLELEKLPSGRAFLKLVARAINDFDSLKLP